MKKPTPGPWWWERPFVDRYSHDGGHYTTEADFLLVHPVDDSDDTEIEVRGKNQLANARLISAAPGLLESLKRIHTLYHGPDCAGDDCPSARIIAKAERPITDSQNQPPRKSAKKD